MSLPDSRLLVVDDNEDNRYTLIQRLKRQGYTNVATAANGREALEMLQRERFDLVLLDVMMPELNGYEVLENLKADERLRQTPVIMISAVDQLQSVVRCIELGAEDYLAKPFNATLLRARVGASLEKKALRDATAAHLAHIEADLESARETQLGMVPSDFPQPTAEAPAEIFATLKPASQVGGDLYDFFYIDPRTLCLVIADVSGKGAPAALFMAQTNSMLRLVAALLRGPEGGHCGPAEILERVNDELCRTNGAGLFVTMFLAILDLETRVLSFCSAGHQFPYVTNAARGVAHIEGAAGIPLGIDDKARYETGTHTLSREDCLFLYTDGVTEAMDRHRDFFTESRLQQTLIRVSGAPARDVVQEVIASVAEFAGGAPQADDIAVMAVRA